MKNLHLKIVGDVNDADYVTEISDISHLSKEEVIDLYNRISEFNPLKDFDDEINGYLPFMDNQELHTIESIELLEIKKLSISDLK